jgi:hypothetical protein
MPILTLTFYLLGNDRQENHYVLIQTKIETKPFDHRFLRAFGKKVTHKNET